MHFPIGQLLISGNILPGTHSDHNYQNPRTNFDQAKKYPIHFPNNHRGKQNPKTNTYSINKDKTRYHHLKLCFSQLQMTRCPGVL